MRVAPEVWRARDALAFSNLSRRRGMDCKRAKRGSRGWMGERSQVVGLEGRPSEPGGVGQERLARGGLRQDRRAGNRVPLRALEAGKEAGWPRWSCLGQFPEVRRGAFVCRPSGLNGPKRSVLACAVGERGRVRPEGKKGTAAEGRRPALARERGIERRDGRSTGATFFGSRKGAGRAPRWRRERRGKSARWLHRRSGPETTSNEGPGGGRRPSG